MAHFCGHFADHQCLQMLRNRRPSCASGFGLRGVRTRMSESLRNACSSRRDHVSSRLVGHVPVRAMIGKENDLPPGVALLEQVGATQLVLFTPTGKDASSGEITHVQGKALL
jgi:hypothetical protein